MRQGPRAKGQAAARRSALKRSMKAVVSYLIDHSMSSGKFFASLSMVSTTAFLICSPLALASWEITTNAAGLPSTLMSQVYSSAPSSTRATSLIALLALSAA